MRYVTVWGVHLRQLLPRPLYNSFSFNFVSINVAVNNMKLFSVAIHMQQWVHIALLSRYKIFRIAANNINLLKPSGNFTYDQV
jgi:hypothetical protein